MKKFVHIPFLLFAVCNAEAQDTCLPKYDVPVKTILLTTGRLAYVEKGKGKTILFIHGLGGNIAHWTKSVTKLSSDYKCIAIDLPGYGWSDRITDAKGKDQLQLYADVVAEFLSRKKIKKVYLAGHSMGAQVAIITSLHNKRVKKLLLVSPAGLETFSEKERQVLLTATAPASFEKQDETVIRNNFKLNFFAQPADAEVLIQDRLRIKDCPNIKTYSETVSAGVKGMLAHPVKDSLRYLKMPVLILFGSNDGLIPNKYFHPALTTTALAQEAGSLVPGAKVAFIDKAGHMVIFEKNAETNKIIKNFLQ
jgi:pimeloyl-ACP methyl ester carboxylesterase